MLAGLDYTGSFKGFDLNANVSGGGLGALRKNSYVNSDGVGVDFGYQTASGLSVVTNNQEGFRYGFTGTFATMGNSTENRMSSSAQVAAVYDTEHSTFSANAIADYSRRNIKGVFNENINNDLTIGGSAQLTFKNTFDGHGSTSVYAAMSQSINPERIGHNTPDVTVGARIKLK